jgi:hypothetical protein
MTRIQSRSPVCIDPTTLACTPPSIPIAPASAATSDDEPPRERVRRVFFHRLPEIGRAERRTSEATIEHKPIKARETTRSRLWSMAANEAALDVALDRLIDHVLALNAGISDA